MSVQMICEAMFFVCGNISYARLNGIV